VHQDGGLPSGEGYLRQHHVGGRDKGESGTSVDVNDVRTLVPLRIVMVFPCGFDFSTSPWIITPDNLLTGRSMKKTDYVMLSIDFCSRTCNHAPLAHLCNDEL